MRSNTQTALAFMILMALRVESHKGSRPQLEILPQDPINVCFGVAQALTPSTFISQRVLSVMRVSETRSL